MKEEEQVPASESDRNPVSDEKSLDTLESKELEQPTNCWKSFRLNSEKSQCNSWRPSLNSIQESRQ